MTSLHSHSTRRAALGRGLASAVLLASGFLGGNVALANPPAAPIDQSAVCDEDLASIAAATFEELANVIGSLAGSANGCATFDEAGNLLVPTTTGLFVYHLETGLPVFTTGVEDWVWQDGGVFFYAFPGAEGVPATADDPTPGAPRLATPVDAAAPAPAVSPDPAPAPAPAEVQAPAASAGAALGGTYVGVVQTRQKLTIEVSPDGSQINSIAAVVWCTDMSDTKHIETITYAPGGSFPIGRDGKASFSDLKETLDRVTYTHYLDAQFSGDQVTGTLKIKSFVSGPAAACNTSDLAFTATRQ